MASTSTRNEEKKGSRSPQATTSLVGCPKASLSRSEEFLTRISTELTNEALFIAGYHMDSLPKKEKQTQDRGTQISRHVPAETAPLPRHTFSHPVVTRPTDFGFSGWGYYFKLTTKAGDKIQGTVLFSRNTA